MIDRGYYDEDAFKNVKDLKKDTDDITDKYKDIITNLDRVYVSKLAKKDKEIKEVDNFTEISKGETQEANEADEVARNNEQVKKNKEKKEIRQLWGKERRNKA